jgi:hypothetical protein
MSKTPKIVEAPATNLEKTSDAPKPFKPANLHQVRQEIVQLVSEHACDMVLRTIQEAKKGHHAAMKFLFEMTGLYPASSVEDNREGDGLAKLLLEQLGISPEPERDTVAESLQLAPVETRHAVK